MENISHLRSKIDDSLRQTSAYADVKKLIQDHAASTSLASGLSERSALEVLLARSIPLAENSPTLAPPTTLDVGAHVESIPGFGPRSSSLRRRTGGLQLRVSLRGGRNFEGGLVDHDTGSVRWALRCSLLFRGQRAVGQAVEVAPGTKAPKLEGSFLFEVASEDVCMELLQGDCLAALASSPDLVKVCITKEVVGAGTFGHVPAAATTAAFDRGGYGGSTASDSTLSGLSRLLVATAAVDWRQALTSRGGQSLAVTLRPTGDDQEMEGSSGLLIVGLDLIAAADSTSSSSSSSSSPSPAVLLLSQLDGNDGDGGGSRGAVAVAAAVGREAAEEAQRTQEATRTLFLHARAWWNDLVRKQHLASVNATLAAATTAAAASTTAATAAATAAAASATMTVSSSSSSSPRALKLFAVDETDGQRKFVCLFLQPLRTGRLLASPRHALRFVSLLPLDNHQRNYHQQQLIGGSSRAGAESWASHFSFLSTRSGDAEAHALLLCSLLLGFGLDAFVALGTRKVVAKAPAPLQQHVQQKVVEVDYAWVITFGGAGGGGAGGGAGRGSPHPGTPTSSSNVVGWDPVGGVREPYEAFARRLGLSTCQCLFNADHVNANLHPALPVLQTSLDLNDDRCWKRFPETTTAATTTHSPLPPPGQSNAMSSSSSSSSSSAHPPSSSASVAAVALTRLPRVNAGFALLPPWAAGGGLPSGGLGRSGCGLGSGFGGGGGGEFCCHALEEALESELRRRVVAWRGQQLSPRLRTHWDEELCYLLEPALAAYETERCLGVSFGNDDFTDSIRRAVPEGFQFKGFPACFGHADVNEIWRSLTALTPGAVVHNEASSASDGGGGGGGSGRRTPHSRESSTGRRSSSSGGVALDLLSSQGSEVHMALRVKAVPFPDGMCATWVMLAVKLRPLTTSRT